MSVAPGSDRGRVTVKGKTMAFGMNVRTGDFLPVAKYDARAGKFFKMDKRMDGGSDATEVPQGTKFALDIGTFEAGYVSFGPQGPVRHMVPYYKGVAMPPQPQDKDAEGKNVFRSGFWSKIAGNAIDGAREWCSNAAVLVNAMDELWEKAVVFPEAAAGKIPLVSIIGTIPVKSGTGAKASTNYGPIFKLEGWVDRPAMLGPRTVPMPGAATQPVQPAQPVRAAEPVPAQAVHAAASGIESEIPF